MVIFHSYVSHYQRVSAGLGCDFLRINPLLTFKRTNQEELMPEESKPDSLTMTGGIIVRYKGKGKAGDRTAPGGFGWLETMRSIEKLQTLRRQIITI